MTRIPSSRSRSRIQDPVQLQVRESPFPQTEISHITWEKKVIIRGRNTDSDTTYLFITGPGTFKDGPGIPTSGGKLTSPLQGVVSGNPDSFTTVKTNPDKTWEYVFYTANLPVDAGTYNIYAVSQPKALDQAGPAAVGDGIILKKTIHHRTDLSRNNITRTTY